LRSLDRSDIKILGLSSRSEGAASAAFRRFPEESKMLEAKGLDHFMDVCDAIYGSQLSDAQL
jgi:hypothetical protein